MKKRTFKQIDFRLNFSKYTIEENGLRINKIKIFSSKELFVRFEDVGTEIIEEKDRKFVWLCFSILFLILSISVFIRRLKGYKVGDGAEIFHLTVSFLFFSVYEIRSRNELFLYLDACTSRIRFDGAALYKRHLNRFIKELLQKKETYLNKKYPAIKGLTLQEVINCVSARLDPSDGLFLKKLTKGRIEKVIFDSYNKNNEYADAISCVTTEENAINIIKESRDQLIKEGKNIFIYEYSYESWKKQYRLCLIGTTDNIIEIVNLVGTSGVNYDVYTKDIIEKYKKWDNQFGLFPIAIGRDFCDFEIVGAVDYKILAKEVYEFSPDVVDQGTGTINKLQKEMEKNRRIFLWWD